MLLWTFSLLAHAGPMTVAELNAGSGLDHARVYGSVAKVYTCPPCPDGAFCKPCMGDNFVLSDNPEAIADWTLGKTEVVVYADRPLPPVGAVVVADLSLRAGPAPHGAPVVVELAGPPRVYENVEVMHRVDPGMPAAPGVSDVRCVALVDLDAEGQPIALEVLGCQAPFEDEVYRVLTHWRWKGSGAPAYARVGVNFKRA